MRGKIVVELVEELRLRRFTQLTREEVRRMFGLDDIRKSRVWQEAHEEGRVQEKREPARRLLFRGTPLNEIAELTGLSAAKVRLTKSRG